MYRLVWPLALRRGVWLLFAVLLLMPWLGRPSVPKQPVAAIYIPVNRLVPSAVLAHLRAERLRQEHHFVISSLPVDTVPLPVVPGSPAPVIFRVATKNPVFFITIDDGVTKQADLAAFLTDHQLPVTAFLTIHNIQTNFDYFKPLQTAGMVIENHSLVHPHMRGLPIERQRQEICQTGDILQQQYRLRPSLFRPPYGEYDDTTQKATADCGLKAVVWWSATMYQGVLTFQPPHTSLVPGDIVLLHFHPGLKHDLDQLLQTAAKQGLELGRLEDYVR